VVSGDEDFMTDSLVAARADAAPANDVGGIECLEEEKKGISGDIKDVCPEARGVGF